MKTGSDGSSCSMMLDEDKYVFIEEETEVAFECEGKAGKNSKTTINLVNGGTINEIENPLGDDETYEVKTPNSLMAVRGTRFRVSCYYGSDGILYTRLSVLNGKVECRLVYPDGSISTESHIAPVGNEVLMYYDEKTGVTDFAYFDSDGKYTTKDTGAVVNPIDYSKMPRQALEYILGRIKDGATIDAISEDELQDILDEQTGEMDPEPELDFDSLNEEDEIDEADAADEEEEEEEQPKKPSEATESAATVDSTPDPTPVINIPINPTPDPTPDPTPTPDPEPDPDPTPTDPTEVTACTSSDVQSIEFSTDAETGNTVANVAIAVSGGQEIMEAVFDYTPPSAADPNAYLTHSDLGTLTLTPGATAWVYTPIGG